MATVLIVSKTKMANGVCVGGINEYTGELIRLHNERGGNLKDDAPYEIGDRWDLSVETAWNVREAPHVEDKQTLPIRKIGNVGTQGIIDYVRNHNLGSRLYSGSLNGTFEGCLQSRIYVTKDRVPGFSTQFWIPDDSLTHIVSYEKDYYLYHGVKIKYVGLLPAIARIPAGSIVRLSLAYWFDGVELRQLVGAGDLFLLQQDASQDVGFDHLADLKVDGFLLCQTFIQRVLSFPPWYRDSFVHWLSGSLLV